MSWGLNHKPAQWERSCDLRHISATCMAPHMPLFHRLMKISGEGEIDALCVTYPGLYRYAKVLERLALGIRSGEVKVPS